MADGDGAAAISASVSDLDIGAPGILDDLTFDDPAPPLVELIETLAGSDFRKQVST